MSFKENIKFEHPSVKIMDLVDSIFNNCPQLKTIISTAVDFDNAMKDIEQMLREEIAKNQRVKLFLENTLNESAFSQLKWADYALIRLWDYLNFSGQEFLFHGELGDKVKTHPFKILWQTVREQKKVATEDFFMDMLQLVKQLNNKKDRPQQNLTQIKEWMEQHFSGMDTEVQALRLANKKRIINILIREIEQAKTPSISFHFEANDLKAEKTAKVETWWTDYRFHLKFAIRKPALLNEMLDYSLSAKTMKLFEQAEKKGIPFFVNPYYLSLILVNPPENMKNSDQSLRDYIFYSQDLVEEFGKIKAWEKEDVIEDGKPNAAGWLLPNEHNIHRRYPEVAIFIPDSMGRACGGLCVSCQRMYDFQRGNLNFNLKQLKPKESWNEKLQKLMEYFEFDSHLKDILITGGDAFMSNTTTIEKILEAVYQMAKRKRERNKLRSDGEKFDEMQRIRFGTRLPAYLPHRIDDKLIKVLTDFKKRATEIGFQEFVIQVHFESPMEITPEASIAIHKLNSSGWLVVNQQVFTTATSRRGYASKLRMMLNNLGVVPYYTFSVKGFKENRHNFATIARATQEMVEEKIFGKLPTKLDLGEQLTNQDKPNSKILQDLLKEYKLPFLATDRSVFNLPALGKSMTYRVIGITANGRRILMFSYDQTRNHSPILQASDQVILVESKSISNYLNQIKSIGECKEDYKGIYGYSMSFTESRSKVFEYPKSNIDTTQHFSNFIY